MKKSILKTLSLGILFTQALSNNVNAQAYSESFENVSTLSSNGFTLLNLASPVGFVPNWYQGNSSEYNAQNGTSSSYIKATSSFAVGYDVDVSGHLMTPTRTISNGDVFSFWTRSDYAGFAERLTVLLSLNGVSSNVADFTQVLLDINPTLADFGFSTTWTQYSVTISGLAAPTNGRFSLNYSSVYCEECINYGIGIGIDNMSYTPVNCAGLSINQTTIPPATVGTPYSPILTQTGGFGAVVYSVTSGTLPNGVSIDTNGVFNGTPSNFGTFNFTVTVTDANGCNSSTNYTVTAVCPSNPTSITSFPELCENHELYTLIEGAPIGGIYTGTGVLGGSFDPSVGSQLITYVYTILGCTYSSTDTIIVQECASITEKENNDLVAFPNPSSGLFKISFKNENLISLNILDIHGQLLETMKNFENDFFMLDLTMYADGIYFIQGNNIIIRLIKQ